MELLTESLAGDRLASRAELEKLFLYVGGAPKVSVADVEAIVGDTTETRIDHVIDAALLGDSEGVERGFQRLLADGESLSALATLALRHLIFVQSLRLTFDAGADASAAVAQARPPIFQRRKSTVEQQVKRWPIPALRDARRLLDRAVALGRLQPGLETAVISKALHEIGLIARQQKRGMAA
jgi:DNA polymerase-3 subunit delta